MATLTWAQLRADICDRLDVDEEDVIAGTSMFNEPTLMRWANEGCADLARRVLNIPETKAYTTQADEQYYDMPDDMVKAYGVEYRRTSNHVSPLEYTERLDEIAGVIRLGSGFPQYWSTVGAPGIGGRIWVYPPPSETIDDGLRVHYFRLPREISEDEDEVEVPSGWGDVVALYVEAWCRRKEQKDNRWRDAYQMYEQRLEEMRRTISEYSTGPRSFSMTNFGPADYQPW